MSFINTVAQRVFGVQLPPSPSTILTPMPMMGLSGHDIVDSAYLEGMPPQTEGMPPQILVFKGRDQIHVPFGTRNIYIANPSIIPSDITPEDTLIVTFHSGIEAGLLCYFDKGWKVRRLGAEATPPDPNIRKGEGVMQNMNVSDLLGYKHLSWGIYHFTTCDTQFTFVISQPTPADVPSALHIPTRYDQDFSKGNPPEPINPYAEMINRAVIPCNDVEAYNHNSMAYNIKTPDIDRRTGEAFLERLFAFDPSTGKIIMFADKLPYGGGYASLPTELAGYPTAYFLEDGSCGEIGECTPRARERINHFSEDLKQYLKH